MGIAVSSLTRKVEEVGRPVSRSMVPLTSALALNVGGPSVAVSPDGRYVAYSAGKPGSELLYIRAVDQLEASPVDGSERATSLLFSPDSQSLGFTVGRRLMKVSVNGGAPFAIAELVGGPRGFSWSDEAIILPHDNATGLFQLPLEGGAATPLTVLSPERGETTHRLPQLLPGGKAVLFTVSRNDIQSYDDASIAVASLEASLDIGEHRVVLQGGMCARYVPTGHLVYARGGALFAIAFDLETLSVEGSSRRFRSRAPRHALSTA